METNCYIPSSIIDRVDFFYGRIISSSKMLALVLKSSEWSLQNGADKPKERNIVT